MPETAVVGLFGAAGRMGAEILRLGPEFAALDLRYRWDNRAPAEPVPAVLPANVTLAIDFSLATAVPAHLKLAQARGAAYLCGVTGLSEGVQVALQQAAQQIPVLWSPNMSVAMNLMFALAQTAARTLPDYARQIIETHHTQKKDAPSGTALRLNAAIHDTVHEDTAITALRMGDVVGEHRLIFGGPGERLEIIHRADSRAVFAAGALRAAVWLSSQCPGFYTMQNVLGL
jgi:4-hydroxy-tetrahydrodipicolinate reductase